MYISALKKRVDNLCNRIINLNKDKWRLNIVNIFYQGEDNDINHNKKYRLNYKGKNLVYDNIEDFYKEYNVYPNKDINAQIIEIVDNSYLERVMYE